jgi:O-antigen/teichoic acid export membrane protein
MAALLARLNTRLGRNAAVKLLSEAGSRLATFVLVLIVARRLPEAAFGLYNYGIALGFVVAQIADLGLQMVLAREVARQGREARALVRTALRLKGGLSLLVLLVLLWLTAAYEPVVRLALLSLGASMLAQTYLEFVAHIFRGQQRLLVEAQLLASARLLSALLGVCVLLLGGDLLALAAGNLLSIGLLATLSLNRLRRDGWLGPATGPTAYLPLLRQALPLGVAILLSIAYTRVAVLLLQARAGELLVASFSAAHRLVEPGQILPASLLAAVFPAYAHALGTDPQRARRLARRTALFLAAAGLAAAICFWLLAPWLIPFLYGPGFAASVPVLRILGLSTMPAFVNYSFTHYLIARGRQGVLGFFTGAMLLVHAVLSWVLIPRLGAVGPALSVVLAECLLLICCLGALRLAAPAVIDDASPTPADSDSARAPAAI